jgi:hypothetical protein
VIKKIGRSMMSFAFSSSFSHGTFCFSFTLAVFVFFLDIKKHTLKIHFFFFHRIAAVSAVRKPAVALGAASESNLRFSSFWLLLCVVFFLLWMLMVGIDLMMVGRWKLNEVGEGKVGSEFFNQVENFDA